MCVFSRVYIRVGCPGLRSVASGGHVLNCQVGMVGLWLPVGTPKTPKLGWDDVALFFLKGRHLEKTHIHSKVLTELLMLLMFYRGNK